MEFDSRGVRDSMADSRSTNLRKLARDTRGAEIAETAVVLPLLFLALLGIFWFGQAYRIYGTLTHASRVGAAAAVAPACTTCTAIANPAVNAQAAAEAALANAHLDKNNLVDNTRWTRTHPALCVCGSASNSCPSTVPCDVTVTNMCVQVRVQLSYPSQGGMGTCGTSVSMRYQYPYHFGVPGTSLDLGNLQIPGQAQMRLEGQ